jgi:hypothetical protein
LAGWVLTVLDSRLRQAWNEAIDATSVMIEEFMFFALGFLAASLLAFIVVPFIHNRAERLTLRRIEASNLVSIAEVRHLNHEYSVETDWLRGAKRTLAEREVTKLNMELEERSRTADTQRIEIVALKIQIDALKDQVADFGKYGTQERIDPERRRAVLRLVH